MYVPEKNRFDFYIGNEYQRGTVVFNEEGNEATVTVPTLNSDTHGELVNYIYTVKIAKPIDPIVQQTKAEPLLTKKRRRVFPIKLSSKVQKGCRKTY